MTDGVPHDLPGRAPDDHDGQDDLDRGAPSGDAKASPERGQSRESGPKRDIVDLGADRAEDAPGRDDESTKGRQAETSGGDTEREPGVQQEKPRKNDDNPAAPPPKSVFIIAGLVLLAAVAWGGFRHWRTYENSRQTSQDMLDHPVDVRTTEAKRVDTPLDLTLPGETQAFDTADIYARATGYIDQRRVDIGSRVKQGDLLIHIAAPDLDQQLAQAEAQIGQTRASLVQAQAQVSQAEANVNLAKVNFARTNQLTQQGYDSLQNRDTQQANVETQQANVEAAKAGVRVAEANIQAQQANIDRLKALASFEDVRAPFAGIVTARNVDLGELVNADQSTGSPMFTLVRDDVIRVMVRVPQSAAIGVHQGLEAKIKVAQMPDRDFSGRVQRSSVALLYASRTLTTEVDVPNPAGDLRPGLYVSVSFAIPREQPDVNIPAEALIFNQHGMQVAAVADGAVTMHPVEIYRDHGTDVDLRKGLAGGERIVLNPPATLKDGTKVKETKEEDEKAQDAKDKKTASAAGQAKTEQGTAKD